MSVLLILSAGGIMLFTLYGSHREMQKAADQGALAAAAGLPILNPSQTLDSLGLQQNYQLLEGVGLDDALNGLQQVPDPRAVGCAYAARNLQADSAGLVTKFGENLNAGGWCSTDPRVDIQLNSLTSGLTQCVGNLTSGITSVQNQLTSGLNGLLNRVLTLGFTVGDLVNGLVPPLLRPIVTNALGLLGLSVSQVQTLVNSVPQAVARLDEVLQSVTRLEALTPALATPRVTVTVTERVSPPMMSFATGGDGVEMTVSATAERRLKNVIVLPGTPLLGVDLNEPLNASRDEILGTLSAVNTELNGVVSRLSALGLGNLSGCQNLLAPSSQLYQDIASLYDPPDAAPYTGRDLIEGATEAVQRVANNSGAGVDAIAGEAFLVIAQGGPTPTTLQNVLGASVTTLGLSSTLNTLPIPALDVALVAAHHLESDDPLSEEMVIDTLSARGLFTAKLVS